MILEIQNWKVHKFSSGNFSLTALKGEWRSCLYDIHRVMINRVKFAAYCLTQANMYFLSLF